MFYDMFFEGKEKGEGKTHIIYIHARIRRNKKEKGKGGWNKYNQ